MGCVGGRWDACSTRTGLRGWLPSNHVTEIDARSIVLDQVLAREHTKNTQRTHRTHREHAENTQKTQRTRREHTENPQRTHREHTENTQRTHRDTFLWSLIRCLRAVFCGVLCVFCVFCVFSVSSAVH